MITTATADYYDIFNFGHKLLVGNRYFYEGPIIRFDLLVYSDVTCEKRQNIR